MPFFSKKKAPSIETAGKGHNPYLNARQEWLERYGGYISRAAQAHSGFFCLIITGISITGNVIQANQVKTIPYIIEVDKLGKSPWSPAPMWPASRRNGLFSRKSRLVLPIGAR